MVSLSLQSFPEQIISCDCFTSMVPMNLRFNAKDPMPFVRTRLALQCTQKLKLFILLALHQ